MRSGAPDVLDCIVPTAYGNLAVDLLLRGETGRMVALRDGRYGSVPIDRVVATKKIVDVEKLYDTERYRPKYTAWSSRRCWYSGRRAEDGPVTGADDTGAPGRAVKRVLLVPDGMADEPIAELGGRTPLAVADTPAMDALARRGTVGLVRTVPAGMPPGSDVGNLSVLGYDPAAVYSGRSPLEAVNIVDLGPDDVSYRCNLVTVSGGIMKDNTAGHIGNDDAHRCFAALSERLDGDGFEFHAGVTYRGLLVWRGGELVACTPPHDILDRPVAGHLPGEQAGEAATPAARRLTELQRRADEVLAGVRPATNAWFWGEGRAPSMPRFADLYGLARRGRLRRRPGARHRPARRSRRHRRPRRDRRPRHRLRRQGARRPRGARRRTTSSGSTSRRPTRRRTWGASPRRSRR